MRLQSLVFPCLLALLSLDMAAQQKRMVFPQFANGGGFRSTLILQNTTRATVTGQAEFFRPNGSPFRLRFTDGQEGGLRNFELGPHRSLFLETDGSGDLSAGWVRVTSGSDLGGTIIFSQFDGGGRRMTEAGVGAATLGAELSIPVDARQALGFNTGAALVNIGNESAVIGLRLLDTSGAVLGSLTLPLSPMNHSARFVTELFPGVSLTQGTLSVTSSVPIAVVALRTAPNILTTLPVSPGAAGAPLSPALGPYRGLTSQGTPTFYLSALNRSGNLFVYFNSFTRVECAERPTIATNSALEMAPVDANGEFHLINRNTTGAEVTQVTGRFITSTKAVGTAKFAGFSAGTGHGLCDPIQFTWEASLNPDAPTLSRVSITGTPPFTTFALNYSGSAPHADVTSLILQVVDATGKVQSLPSTISSDAPGFFTFSRTAGITASRGLRPPEAGLMVTLVDMQGNQSVPMIALFPANPSKTVGELSGAEAASARDGIEFKLLQ